MTPLAYHMLLALGLLALAQGAIAASWAIRELRAQATRRALAAPLPRWAGHAVGADPTVIPATYVIANKEGR